MYRYQPRDTGVPAARFELSFQITMIKVIIVFNNKYKHEIVILKKERVFCKLKTYMSQQTIHFDYSYLQEIGVLGFWGFGDDGHR